MYSITLYRNGECRHYYSNHFVERLEKHFDGVEIGLASLWIGVFSPCDEFEVYSKDFNKSVSNQNVSATVSLVSDDNLHKLQHFTPDFIDGLYYLRFLKDFYKNRVKHNKQPIEVHKSDPF